MHKHHLSRIFLSVVASLTFLAPTAAFSECSRVMNVPVSVTGLSVIVNKGLIGGVYPDLLAAAASGGGCQFSFSVVPRARLESMFENGEADLLIPATRTPLRDRQGIFVPLIYSRAMLISVASNKPPIQTARQLLDRRDLRVALVRGFDYGDAYQILLQELGRQGRLFLEVDANAIARLMGMGAIDATIMAPSILAGAVLGDQRGSQILLTKLRYEPLDELPWGDSGAYISRRSVNGPDKAALQELLDRTSRSGDVWKSFQSYYPPEVLNGAIRPRR